MRRTPRWAALSVPVALLAAAGCAGIGERPPRPQTPPSMGVMTAMGYNDVVQLGSAWASAQLGENARFQEASELWPNYWRLRFGLADDRLVDVYFDGARRSIIRTEEVTGVTARMSP